MSCKKHRLQFAYSDALLVSHLATRVHGLRVQGFLGDSTHTSYAKLSFTGARSVLGAYSGGRGDKRWSQNLSPKP